MSCWGKQHKAMAVQTQLIHTGAILSLYQCHLPQGERDSHGISGNVAEIRVLLLDDAASHLALEPSPMFGVEVVTVLQPAHESRRCAQEISGLLGLLSRASWITQPLPTTTPELGYEGPEIRGTSTIN